jgi:hypothetical protein
MLHAFLFRRSQNGTVYRERSPQEIGSQNSAKLLLARRLQPALKDSPMYILRLLPFFFLAQGILAQQPTPIIPDPKLTPGDQTRFGRFLLGQSSGNSC